jgi:hypothetical protein
MDRRTFLSTTAAAVAGNVLAHPDPALAQSTDAGPTNPNARSVRMSTPNELVISYIAAWNETDAKRRRELVARTWTESGSYVDAHRRGEGHAGIDSMIDKAQRQFPGYRLRLVSKIEAHNGFIRFGWAAGGSEQAPLYLAGTDFGVTAADGRLQSVTGFVDAAPAPAA